MAIRICEKCGSPRVLQYPRLELLEGNVIAKQRRLPVSCGCGLSSVNDADVDARPDLFVEPCGFRRMNKADEVT
jgi:hypothetical protein